MAARVLLSDLKSGRCSSDVDARVLHFWEARNVKRGGELMWVNMLLIDLNSTVMQATINASRIHKFFIQTLLLLFSKRDVPDRALNFARILVFWTWFPLLVSCLPTWPERFFFVFTSFTVTALQHIQFMLNHFAADVYMGPPTGDDWFEKQTAGTLDISCTSYMDWFFGGLQFKLEHHLFPRLPRCHRKVAPVVQELCKKHNLPYRNLSWWEANVLD